MRINKRTKAQARQRNWCKYRIEGIRASLNNIRSKGYVTAKERQLIKKAEYYLKELSNSWSGNTNKMGFNRNK